MNIVNLIGRTTRDIELSTTQGKGTAIAKTSLAVDNPFTEKVDFIRLVAFGKTAEFMDKYIKQGTRIGVTGRIETGSYEHQDGYTVYTTDVIVNNVYFADGKKEESQKNSSKKGGYKSNSKK